MQSRRPRRFWEKPWGALCTLHGDIAVSPSWHFDSLLTAHSIVSHTYLVK